MQTNSTTLLINRREALRRTALMMGGIVSAPTILGLMQGCTAKPGLDWKPKFFNKEQAQIVSGICAIIIPATDTPGAREAGVPGFIDQLVDEVYDADEKSHFVEGMAAFNGGSATSHGKPFLNLGEAQRVAYLTSVHEEAVKRAKGEETGAKNRPFILEIKELVLVGFFNSEPGATQVLQYQAVPGQYQACVPLSEAGNGKTWAM